MAPASPKEAWAEDCDLEKRDPNDLNDHLQIRFEDVLGEPDHTHTLDCVWKYSHKCFNLWKTLCYLIVTILCGIPIASCWGCYFACIAFQHIWDITPSFRAIAIQCGIIRKFLTLCTESICEPCCMSCGKLFH